MGYIGRKLEYLLGALLTTSLFLAVGGQAVLAEDGPVSARPEQDQQQSEARARLAEGEHFTISGRVERIEGMPKQGAADVASAESFAWAALVKNGAAAGTNPQVGSLSRGPYYDFKDGQPRPYYIVSSGK